MEGTMQKFAAAGFGFALLMAAPIVSAEPVKLTTEQLDTVTAAGETYGQNRQDGRNFGTDGGGGGGGGCFCLQRGDGDSGDYSATVNEPSAAQRTGGDAHMTDKAQP